MTGDGRPSDRAREKTRGGVTESSVFLPPLAGASEDRPRAVVRHDIHLKALESARQVLRTYYSERRRQL